MTSARWTDGSWPCRQTGDARRRPLATPRAPTTAGRSWTSPRVPCRCCWSDRGRAPVRRLSRAGSPARRRGRGSTRTGGPLDPTASGRAARGPRAPAAGPAPRRCAATPRGRAPRLRRGAREQPSRRRHRTPPRRGRWHRRRPAARRSPAGTNQRRRGLADTQCGPAGVRRQVLVGRMPNRSPASAAAVVSRSSASRERPSSSRARATFGTTVTSCTADDVEPTRAIASCAPASASSVRPSAPSTTARVATTSATWCGAPLRASPSASSSRARAPSRCHPAP